MRALHTLGLLIQPKQSSIMKTPGGLKLAPDSVKSKKADPHILLSAIVENSNDAIVSKDLHGIVTSWNHAAEVLFGYTAEEMIGSPISILTPPERMDEIPRILQRIKRGEKVKHYETVRRRKDGRSIFISLTVSPVRDDTGRIVGASKIARDITELVETRKRILELNEALEHRVEERTRELMDVNRELESFVYTVSHDLRAPLRSIQGFGLALMQDYSDRLDGEGADYLDRMVNSARRMDTLITDLLSYSRITRSRRVPEHVSLDDAIGAAIGQVGDSVQRTGAHLEVTPSGFTVCADREFLVHAFVNLLENALKYVSPGRSPQVRVWADRTDARVKVSFQDNGIGIPTEHHERIFELFHRLHSIDMFPGTGIGLAIVRRVIERAGGQVGVESVPGEGSRFWCILPAASEG